MIMMNDSFVTIPTHFPLDLKLSSIHAFPPLFKTTQERRDFIICKSDFNPFNPGRGK